MSDKTVWYSNKSNIKWLLSQCMAVCALHSPLVWYWDAMSLGLRVAALGLFNQRSRSYLKRGRSQFAWRRININPSTDFVEDIVFPGPRIGHCKMHERLPRCTAFTEWTKVFNINILQFWLNVCVRFSTVKIGFELCPDKSKLSKQNRAEVIWSPKFGNLSRPIVNNLLLFFLQLNKKTCFW